MEEMEEMEDDAGDSLAIQTLIGGDCFIVENGMKFRGDDLMVNLKVLRAILDGDDNALHGLPKARRIDDYFGRRPRIPNSSRIEETSDED